MRSCGFPGLLPAWLRFSYSSEPPLFGVGSLELSLLLLEPRDLLFLVLPEGLLVPLSEVDLDAPALSLAGEACLLADELLLDFDLVPLEDGVGDSSSSRLAAAAPAAAPAAAGCRERLVSLAAGEVAVFGDEVCGEGLLTGVMLAAGDAGAPAGGETEGAVAGAVAPGEAAVLAEVLYPLVVVLVPVAETPTPTPTDGLTP